MSDVHSPDTVSVSVLMHGAPRLAMQASSPSSLSDNDGHAGHAFLHDFCMSLPYSGLAAAAAVALAVMGATQAAVQVAMGTAIVAVTAVLSLKQWKVDKSSAPLTLITGGNCGVELLFSPMSVLLPVGFSASC